MGLVDSVCLWFGRIVGGIGASCAMLAVFWWGCDWWWRRFADTRVFFRVLSEYRRKELAAKGAFKRRSEDDSDE